MSPTPAGFPWPPPMDELLSARLPRPAQAGACPPQLGLPRCGGRAGARALTGVLLVEAVHAGEVDGQRFEGGRQAEAALRALHEEPRARSAAGGFGRGGRLGQLRRPILHSEHSPRRLGCWRGASARRAAAGRGEWWGGRGGSGKGLRAPAEGEAQPGSGQGSRRPPGRRRRGVALPACREAESDAGPAGGRRWAIPAAEVRKESAARTAGGSSCSTDAEGAAATCCSARGTARERSTSRWARPAGWLASWLGPPAAGCAPARCPPPNGPSFSPARGAGAAVKSCLESQSEAGRRRRRRGGRRCP